MNEDLIDQDSHPWWLIGLVAGIFLLLTIGGTGLYFQQRSRARQQVEEQLLTIADFKAKEISQWREARQHDAAVLAGNPFFLEAAHAWMKSPDPKNSQKILAYFRTIKTQYSYWNVLLTSPEGKNLLILEGPSGTVLGEIAAKSLAEALRERRVAMTDLLPESGPIPIRIDTIAPLIISSPDGAVPFGALVLVSSVKDYLYPFIQLRPIPSASFESLLIRRDGDSVLFLNELRHRQNTALRFRLPLTLTNVPAAMALLGQQGIVDGFDYRGVKVIAALQPIEKSNWHLVSKIDKAEALAVWHYSSLFIIGLTISLFLAATAIVWAVWQRQMKARYWLYLETEKTRRATEQQYGTILMCIGDGVIVTNAQGIVTLLNPVAEKLTGWTHHEARGKPVEAVFDIYNEDTKQKAENPIRKVMECGRTVGLGNHTILISKSGIEYPIMDSSAPVREANGGLIGIVLVFQDQTREHRTQRLLQKNHNLLNEVGAAALIGGWELDPDSMAGTWTDAMYNIFEIPPEQKPSMKEALLFYHPDDRPKLSNAIDKAIESGEPYDLELRFITAKGKRLWVRSMCKPFVENGKTKRLVGVLQDITSPKLAGLELKEKTEEIERYFSTALDLFCIADANGNLKRLNQEWSSLLGYRLDELEGRSFLEFIHPDDLESTQKVLSELNQQKPVLNHVNRFRCHDGSWRWLEWRAFPSKDNVFAAARNVTDRILAEQQAEKLAQQLQQAMKMEAVGRLAGGVAHDFNNLLTGIGGYVDLIIAGLHSGDPLLDDLNEIKKATERAATLTSQLLAFSRKQLIEPRVLDLNQLIPRLQKMIQRLIGEDIELRTVLFEKLASVKVDPGQFEQILINLAINARDAMPDGGKLTIETANVNIDEDYCSTHPYVKLGRHIMLAVNDTGCGMSEEVKSHLFEPFYTTKEQGRGTGLGLATIYGIVKQSGGSIEVYSEPEKGTAFKIYLPAAEEGPQSPEIEKPAPSAMPKGKETILLVEDEEIVRELTTKVLKRLGYNVLHASNGNEALEIAQHYAGTIDLMITDVVMPGMNGRQLAEKLLQIRSSIQVLFTSGYTENAIAHHGIIEKDLHFIGKPYSSRDLAHIIRRLLD
jgi:two-component system, cell cycle sensor histidine kinase and response regulator CckA